jgi:4-hydroxy-3-methylbut-2-enyl diphosphate reductase IspH
VDLILVVGDKKSSNTTFLAKEFKYPVSHLFDPNADEMEAVGSKE